MLFQTAETAERKALSPAVGRVLAGREEAKVRYAGRAAESSSGSLVREAIGDFELGL